MDTMLMQMRFLGSRLKRLREERFFTQRQLADKAGVSPTTIMQLETGQNEGPRLGTVSKIAKALDVDPRELVEFD